MVSNDVQNRVDGLGPALPSFSMSRRLEQYVTRVGRLLTKKQQSLRILIWREPMIAETKK